MSTFQPPDDPRCRALAITRRGPVMDGRGRVFYIQMRAEWQAPPAGPDSIPF